MTNDTTAAEMIQHLEMVHRVYTSALTDALTIIDGLRVLCRNDGERELVGLISGAVHRLKEGETP